MQEPRRSSYSVALPSSILSLSNKQLTNVSGEFTLGKWASAAIFQAPPGLQKLDHQQTVKDKGCVSFVALPVPREGYLYYPSHWFCCGKYLKMIQHITMLVLATLCPGSLAGHALVGNMADQFLACGDSLAWGS